MESELVVKVQIQSFDLYLGLNLVIRLYSHSYNLSKSTQSKKMFAASSKRLVDLNIQLEEVLDVYLNVS